MGRFTSKCCKDCDKRHVACHDDCPQYLEFRSKVNEARAREMEAKRLERLGMRLGTGKGGRR